MLLLVAPRIQEDFNDSVNNRSAPPLGQNRRSSSHPINRYFFCFFAASSANGIGLADFYSFNCPSPMCFGHKWPIAYASSNMRIRGLATTRHRKP
jgi:hypothetical protein